MVKIRLRRDGAKKRPFYHIVDGRFIEQLGYYNPMVAADVAPVVELKEDRLRYWLGVGAQPTDKVHHILLKSGLIEATTKAEG